MNLADLRENYTRGGLVTEEMDECPFHQLEDWLKTARDQGIPDPNAMTLATANRDGVVTSRTVLLKGIVDQKLQFFTNYQSQKASDLASNPNASFTILWKELERQINIVGTVKKTSRQTSEDYFHSRPYESQIGAWVSERQSEVVESRDLFTERKEALEARFAEGEVPCPDFWGGFELTPTSLEFWQGRQGRLHDRLRYTADSGDWTIDRLSP